MAKSFSEMTEGWIFCGYDILLYKWRRARVLTRSDGDRDLLTRIEDQLRAEMSKEFHRRDIPTVQIEGLITQTNGDRYCSPVIGGRFQILEDWIGAGEGGSMYYVVDHLRDDLLFREAGPASNVLRFISIGDAESFIKEFTGHTASDIEHITTRSGEIETAGVAKTSTQQKGLDTMAKTATATNPAALAAAKKAAATADAKIGAKGKAAAAPVVTTAPVAPKRGRPPATSAVVTPPAPVAGKRGKAAAVTPAPEASSTGRGRSLSSTGTVASVTRDLISAGKLNDEQIVEKVRATFPDKSIAANVAAHYRKQMESRPAA